MISLSTAPAVIDIVFAKVLESVGKAKFGMRRYGDPSVPVNVPWIDHGTWLVTPWWSICMYIYIFICLCTYVYIYVMWYTYVDLAWFHMISMFIFLDNYLSKHWKVRWLSLSIVLEEYLLDPCSLVGRRGDSYSNHSTQGPWETNGCRSCGKPSQATRLVALKLARTFTCRWGTGNGWKRCGAGFIWLTLVRFSEFKDNFLIFEWRVWGSKQSKVHCKYRPIHATGVCTRSIS